MNERTPAPSRQRSTARVILAVGLLALVIVGAIVVIGGLLERVRLPAVSPTRPTVLVGREDGLFLGEATTAAEHPIFDGGRVLAVDRSPSGARIAVRYVPRDGGIAPGVTVAMLDRSGMPIPGSDPRGRLGSLPTGRDGAVLDAGDIAWAPAPVRGHEALAVATGFGVLVVDEAGQPLAEARATDEDATYSVSGVSWSNPDALGTIRLVWGFGSSVWLTTIPTIGRVTSTELVDLRAIDTIRHASPPGRSVAAIALSPDGTRIAAVISGCGFACRAGLWLVDDRGATRLLDDAAQTDAWLSFADDGQSVLAGLWGDGRGRVAMVPIDGGPQVDLHVDPPGMLGADATYPVHARWLAGTGRVLIGAPAEPPESWSELTPVGLDFWSATPAGTDFERVATGANAVDALP